MNFEAYKKAVAKLAKKAKVSHWMPDANTLFRLWEKQVPPETVIVVHCTEKAMKNR